MRLSAIRLTTLTGALAAALLAACGGKDAADATDSAAAADTAAASADAPQATGQDAAPAAGPSSSAPVAADDIDRWQRGMVAELKAVQAAEEKMKTAKSAMDTASLMMDMTDMGTVGAGARAAGVSEDRYRFVQNTLSSLVAQLTPYEMEMDTKGMPAAMVAEVNKGREASVARISADLQPGVLDAIRPRAVELRKQDMALAGARMKAASGAR